uniref:cellular nucleic acid-binding protein-like n=1 Tax=Osmia lignaria TaxID=473952 RepID=UPI001478B1CE|nr:cellular nucleic acid-binding protein-like [Osmia lignaria]
MNKLKGRYCQYCQIKGHTVSECPFIIEYETCWKCRGTGHDPNTCTKFPKITELCEICNSRYHTTKDCATPTCQLCNELGHTAKNSPTTKTNGLQSIMCTICKEEGHNAENCEEARVFQTRTNQIKCQLCKQLGHSAEDCHEPRKPQQKSNDSYRSNYHRRYNHNDSNYFKNSNDNRDNPKHTSEPRKFCEYCRTPNHTIKECRKLKAIEIRAQKRDICPYCEEPGHQLSLCRKLKDLESSAGKVCNLCKSTSQTTEECYRNQNHQQHRPGNE